MNRNLHLNLTPFLRGTALKRGAIFGTILVMALVAFEVFNFSTTQFALRDMLGDLSFAGLDGRPSWRLPSAAWISPASPASSPPSRAAMNRTRSGISSVPGCWPQASTPLSPGGASPSPSLNHQPQARSSSAGTLTRIVPVFVAGMVWLIRVLIIGTFSIAGERLFSVAEQHAGSRPFQRREESQPPAQPGDSSPFHPMCVPRPAPSPRGCWHA